MSLQARITLSVAAAVAVILAAFGYSATWAIRESTSTVLRDRLQIAEIVADQVAAALTLDKAALREVAQGLSPAGGGGWERRHSGGDAHFTGLAVVTVGGNFLWSSPAPWPGPSLQGLVPLFRSLRAVPGADLPLFVPLPGARRVAALLPVGDDRVLVGAVDFSRLGLAGFFPRSNGAPLAVELVNGRGLVLASSDSQEVGQQSEHLPVIAPLVRSGHPGIVFHNVPGHPHYVAYAPVPGYPGWAVDVEQSRDLVLALPRGLERRMALLGVVIVAGMSLLAFWDVRRVVLPLARLRQAAEQIAGGDLDHPVRVERRDEVGHLARTFEAMRVALKASREEIAAWNRELEARVAERTRALQEMAEENARLFAIARREERNLASTVDLLSDGLLTLTLDRRILALNPAAERLLGWRSDEARGLMCTELLACPGCLSDHDGASCLLLAALETDRPVRGVRLRARRRGGETFPVSLTAGLGRDEKDRPTHFIVTISDMTTEETYEQQLRGRIRQLTMLHQVAQALNLLPLQTVEETARAIEQRISSVTGGRCRLELAPLWDGSVAPGGAGAVAGTLRDLPAPGPVGEPLVIQGRPVGMLWLDPGPAGFVEGAPSLLGIIASQVAVAVENAKLYEEVRDRDALRRQLLERLVTAQEEERHRIARELHDEVGQALTALVMQVGGIVRSLPPEAAALRERLSRIREMTSQTIEEVRRLMLNLRPAVLDDLGLVPALRWYAETYVRPVGVEPQVVVAGLEEHQRLPAPVELMAFRLTQEALTNVLRHARATRVVIALERRNEVLALSVSDNGCGFDAVQHRRPGPQGGWGLVGMRERAELLGGSLEVVSAPGHGTRVVVTIPLGEVANGHSGPDRR
jgi:PAS domain S-box-containing protein